MNEMTCTRMREERRRWLVAGRPLPLEVMQYRDDDVKSWEVCWWDSPWNGNGGCQSPIAEFTDWSEAQEWAVAEARKSTMRADSRRTLGPMTQYQQAHHDAWAAYEAGVGPHPYTTELERLALLSPVSKQEQTDE